MVDPKIKGKLTHGELAEVLDEEKETFKHHYSWLENHFGEDFFKEITHEELLLIVHNLLHFQTSGYFCHLSIPETSIILSLDTSDSDVKILNLFMQKGIKYYRSYHSLSPFGFSKHSLKITKITFTNLENSFNDIHHDDRQVKLLYQKMVQFHPNLDEKELKQYFSEIPQLFLSSLSTNHLELALDLFIRAQTRDHCQYYIDDPILLNKKGSLDIILGWKNTPKAAFLYKIAKAIYRHDLKMNHVNMAYIENDKHSPILLMAFSLSQIKGLSHPVDIDDFLKELVTLKYFTNKDVIEYELVDKKSISGNEGNLLRALTNLIHQTLLHIDLNLYSYQHIQEAFCRHPEITSSFMKLFHLRFDPKSHDQAAYEKEEKSFINTIQSLDTGQELYDRRRKEIFKHALNLMVHIVKTNYFRKNKSAFSFRIDPNYLKILPSSLKEKFPELPFGIFFIQGMHFISFHIRFKDISRGGLRSIIPKKSEQFQAEKNNIFSECYNLAYTQQKKNKDIPEGGSKAVILLDSIDTLNEEREIFKKELESSTLDKEKIEKLFSEYEKLQQQELLFSAQRAFVHSLITLTNTSEDHELRAKDIVDYYNQPEYIYLGPDENMSNVMLEWIANHSALCHYPLGKAFISSKPSSGINHKEYGVTSLGVNVYMEEVLNFLEINPIEDSFTIKMTGGPDGDVAGNQILNLYKYYPKTAKLLTLIDGSGLIYDPEGLDLSILADLFHTGKPICEYPAQKLHDQGFLLSSFKKKEESLYSQKTLLTEKKGNQLIENWISSSQMNTLLRHFVHQTKTDVFIPAGGRPRTLNIENYMDFLDKEGHPTSKAIVEGANLYLTQPARTELEKKGVLIIKDSSANKGGVICSSLEVLTALTMPEKEFLAYKNILMPEILDHIKKKAKDEALLLLKTFAETQIPLTKVSEMISEKINTYTYEILAYLEHKTLSYDTKSPLIQCLMSYCLPFLRKNYADSIINNIPQIHQKAMIACYIASSIVYSKGVFWSPSIIEILPLVAKELIDHQSGEER